MVAMDSSERDRRRYPRRESRGLLVGHVLPTEAPLVVRDLSLGGFAAESAAPFTPGASYGFRLSATDGPQLELRAAAVHCRLSEVASDGRPVYITGFEFLGSVSERASLAALLEVLA